MLPDKNMSFWLLWTLSAMSFITFLRFTSDLQSIPPPISSTNSTVSNSMHPPINLTKTEANNVFLSHGRGSENRVHFVRNTEHNLLYCYIPKICTSIFKTLFHALPNHEPAQLQLGKYKVHAKVTQNDTYRPDAQFVADKLLYDASWKSLVVLRDPLERLVSGFVDKCVKKPYVYWCQGTRTTNFSVFVDRIYHKIKRGEIFDIEHHYRPQYTFCGLDKYFEYFDYVLYFQQTTIANDTLAFMQNAGIDDYYYHWGQHHDQTMFDQRTSHASKPKTSVEAKVLFYSQYYDHEIAMKAIYAFDRDYKRFKFPYPEWLSAISSF